MFTASELEGIPAGIESAVRDMQKRTMEDIVRRIKINREITSTADWQMQRLYQLGMTEKDIKKNIADMLGYTDKQIDRIYDIVLKEGYGRDSSLYRKAGIDRTSFEKNADLQRIINAARVQTKESMRNLSNTMGFARVDEGKTRFTDLTAFYRNEIDGCIMDIVSGTSTYSEVLKRAVNDMTRSGVRTIGYAGGKSFRIESAARMTVMTGFNQIIGKMNDEAAAELGIDTFEVEWHGGARPSHQEWQGRVWTGKELETVCGLGKVDGLLGANCYHSYNLFFPGISKRNYSDKWLEEMKRKENTPMEYNGKKYTVYEALQEQRKMEMSIRKCREDIQLLKAGDGDPDDILNAEIKNKIQGAEYARFSKAMNLPQQTDRIDIVRAKSYDNFTDKTAKETKTLTNAELQRKIAKQDDRIEDLKKQFSEITDGYSYFDWFKEFKSIEDGFDGDADESFHKLKKIDSQIKEELQKKRELLLKKEKREQLDTGYKWRVPDEELDSFNDKAFRHIVSDTGYSEEKAKQFHDALKEYFGGDYGKILSGETEASKIIRDGLDRMPVYDGAVRRGITVDNYEASKFTGLKAGDEIPQLSIIESWSSESGTAYAYGGVSDYERSSVIFECVNNETGVGVQHISMHGSVESEVLCSSKYEVIEVATETKYEFLSKHSEYLYSPEDLDYNESVLKENVICIIRVKEKS